MPIGSLLAATLAAVTPCTAGHWALAAGDREIARFAVTPGGPTPRAVWERPRDWDFDGVAFTGVGGPVERRPATRVEAAGDDLTISFDDPSPGATPDTFRLHCAGPDRLEATYEGTQFEPITLTRVAADAPPLGPWDPARRYVREIVRPTNAEMTAIFDADQADRRHDPIDWSVVGPADRRRQERTRALLAAGALHSGEDFYHAAFVFQHGAAPDDYLQAHLLAMIAVARGQTGAVWIGAATLDRYLHSIGRPQVLGTQYKVPRNAPATQEPYDRALVSDAMRQALLVPSLAAQEAQRQALGKAATPAR